MNVSEKRGLEAYPIKEEWVGDQSGIFMDVNEPSRKVYIKGYNQALLDKPNWKPTEEQINALQRAIENYEGDVYHHDIQYLGELSEQLKALLI